MASGQPTRCRPGNRGPRPSTGSPRPTRACGPVHPLPRPRAHRPRSLLGSGVPGPERRHVVGLRQCPARPAECAGSDPDTPRRRCRPGAGQAARLPAATYAFPLFEGRRRLSAGLDVELALEHGRALAVRPGHPCPVAVQRMQPHDLPPHMLPQTDPGAPGTGQARWPPHRPPAARGGLPAAAARCGRSRPGARARRRSNRHSTRAAGHRHRRRDRRLRRPRAVSACLTAARKVSTSSVNGPSGAPLHRLAVGLHEALALGQACSSVCSRLRRLVRACASAESGQKRKARRWRADGGVAVEQEIGEQGLGARAVQAVQRRTVVEHAKLAQESDLQSGHCRTSPSLGNTVTL